MSLAASTPTPTPTPTITSIPELPNLPALALQIATALTQSIQFLTTVTNTPPPPQCGTAAPGCACNANNPATSTPPPQPATRARNRLPDLVTSRLNYFHAQAALMQARAIEVTIRSLNHLQKFQQAINPPAQPQPAAQPAAPVVTPELAAQEIMAAIAKIEAADDWGSKADYIIGPAWLTEDDPYVRPVPDPTIDFETGVPLAALHPPKPTAMDPVPSNNPPLSSSFIVPTSEFTPPPLPQNEAPTTKQKTGQPGCPVKS